MLFYLPLYGAQRALHSFPTRRSSDLRRGSRQHELSPAASAHGGEGSPRTPRRSEEHTSELQSRGQIVCRLLLEKKKYSLRNVQQRNLLTAIYSADTAICMSLMWRRTQ